jgi:hypothetical protein
MERDVRLPTAPWRRLLWTIKVLFVAGGSVPSPGYTPLGEDPRVKSFSAEPEVTMHLSQAGSLLQPSLKLLATRLLGPVPDLL